MIHKLKSPLYEVDFAPYAEALKDACARTRTMLFFLMAGSILLLVAFMKFGVGNWYEEKAKTYAYLAAYLDPDRTLIPLTQEQKEKASKYYDQLDPQDSLVSDDFQRDDEAAGSIVEKRKKSVAQRYAAEAAASAARKIAASDLEIPLFPVKVPEEDAGILSLLLMVPLLLFCGFAIVRERFLLQKAILQTNQVSDHDLANRWRSILGLTHAFMLPFGRKVDGERPAAIVNSILCLPIVVEGFWIYDSRFHNHRPIHSPFRWGLNLTADVLAFGLVTASASYAIAVARRAAAEWQRPELVTEISVRESASGYWSIVLGCVASSFALIYMSAALGSVCPWFGSGVEIGPVWGVVFLLVLLRLVWLSGATGLAKTLAHRVPWFG